MKPTLVEYLMEQPGYHVKEDRLIRPDANASTAAKKIEGNWVTIPAPEEIVKYNIDCGRGSPLILSEKDLTNTEHILKPGHNRRYTL